MHVLTTSSIKRTDLYLALLVGVVMGLTAYFVIYADRMSKFDYYFFPTLIITLCLGVLFCCIEMFSTKPKKR